MFVISSANIHNFTDDNTISAIHDTVDGVLETLELNSKVAVDRLEAIRMIANPTKFKGIMITSTKDKLNNENTKLDIDDRPVFSSQQVDLLDITGINKVSFETHISQLCQKAGGQFNKRFEENFSSSSRHPFPT